jgi:hypothetical protein
MCQFCGCGDYFDLDEDLREMAQDDVDAAYAEQAYRDAESERERQAEEAALDDDDSHFRHHDWLDQARIHEQIERDNQDTY